MRCCGLLYPHFCLSFLFGTWAGVIVVVVVVVAVVVTALFALAWRK
jgi:hypothetical protein